MTGPGGSAPHVAKPGADVDRRCRSQWHRIGGGIQDDLVAGSAIDVGRKLRLPPPTVRRRLTAGAERIRTFSSALDRPQFLVSSEFGRSTGARSSSTCRPRRTDRVVGRGPERRHTKVVLSAVQASRNRRFESVPLQQRVYKPSVPERRTIMPRELLRICPIQRTRFFSVAEMSP